MNSRRGMTLLEVTLALGLLAVLSVFVMQVINSVTDLWSSGERRGRGDLRQDCLLERCLHPTLLLHPDVREQNRQRVWR